MANLCTYRLIRNSTLSGRVRATLSFLLGAYALAGFLTLSITGFYWQAGVCLLLAAFLLGYFVVTLAANLDFE